MRIKIFETVTAAGLEKEINAFLEQNHSMIEVVDIKYRLTTATHGVIVIYKNLQYESNWN